MCRAGSQKGVALSKMASFIMVTTNPSQMFTPVRTACARSSRFQSERFFIAIVHHNKSETNYGVSDAWTRLMFKFSSGIHGLHEQLGRHRGREGRKGCLLCDAECESVSHVCPAYASIRSAFMLELRRELGDRFEHFLQS